MPREDGRRPVGVLGDDPLDGTAGGAPRGAPGHPDNDTADAIAGLDALDTPVVRRTPWWQQLLRTWLPPLVALAAIIGIWQAVWASAVLPEFRLPAPGVVGEQFAEIVIDGSIWSILWTSISRAAIGFLFALAIATPLGLLVAKVPLVRAAIGPLLTGLQSLPSVAWVPAAVLWFGLTDATIFYVVLLGSVPSIANGLVAGIDQVPPILPRAGRVLGATGFAMARFVLLPAALPGYLAGCKQGWAFAWRSLMAAEIIAMGPALGLGLGAYLKNGADVSNISQVFAGILLILIVGIGIELLVFRPLERRVLRARGLALTV
ncbi:MULTISPECIES: ABC transporter permease [Pseudonocardia]|uniref:Sulfate ABC transporter permease n=2 Tax=Pseudonocardia TaxID=1847 RepID=A0ABQ0RT65_9PSEU|nr:MULTISPECIES: ABC transporter permease [Pseudonocardia]OSY37820.1 putative aliphatic sulfonates transport permease protein SsuC [Pseudonocardia autotrophica]TDN72517.1 NitT/TauT family transport system permease protein [Pseudonocardia autotrophica]BBG03226.1 sulfate ABC transporter permease [Pseudonocardia autotrophica]GEC23843.1 sulfate ABC transporter permease [Pseudonocardia saturnea]